MKMLIANITLYHYSLYHKSFVLIYHLTLTLTEQLFYSGKGSVLGGDAFVDGGEVLPVVENVGANLFGCFHGGCAY